MQCAIFHIEQLSLLIKLYILTEAMVARNIYLKIDQTGAETMTITETVPRQNMQERRSISTHREKHLIREPTQTITEPTQRQLSIAQLLEHLEDKLLTIKKQGILGAKTLAVGMDTMFLHLTDLKHSGIPSRETGNWGSPTPKLSNRRQPPFIQNWPIRWKCFIKLNQQ